MIIEWHNHVYPLEEQTSFWQGRCPMTIENVMKKQEEFGIDLCVVTNPLHFLRGLPDAESIGKIAGWNDTAAAIGQEHAGRILGFAGAIPNGGPEMIRELDRAFGQLGLKGVFINSSHNTAYPDDDTAAPFWEIVGHYDVPVFIHPPHVGFGEERMRDYRLTSSVGRPFDLCLSLARLIVRGVLERQPDLKIVASHIGGGICEVIGRMNYAYEMGDEVFFLGSYEPLLISKRPLEYLKMMYLDTVSYHAPALRCALDTMGADHMVYGSDAPPLTSLKADAIQLVNDLDVSEEDRAKLFFWNAAKLLKLPGDWINERVAAHERLAA